MIPHKDALSFSFIGEGGCRVPENMTKMNNYFFNLDARAFRAKQGGGDALSEMRPGKKDGKSNNEYFTCYISSNVETKEIVSQVSVE
jgi:hypothetical protein